MVQRHSRKYLKRKYPRSAPKAISHTNKKLTKGTIMLNLTLNKEAQEISVKHSLVDLSSIKSIWYKKLNQAYVTNLRASQLTLGLHNLGK